MTAFTSAHSPYIYILKYILVLSLSLSSLLTLPSHYSNSKNTFDSTIRLIEQTLTTKGVKSRTNTTRQSAQHILVVEPNGINLRAAR